MYAPGLMEQAMNDGPIGRDEEDRLDWLENQGLPPGALRRREVQLLLPCVALGAGIAAGWWWLRG